MCATCGKRSVTTEPRESRPVSNFVSRFSPITPIEDCPYTLAQLKIWSNLLACTKEKALYFQLGISAQKLNKYLGTVLSALKHTSNPCYFQTDLDNMADLIIAIQSLNRC